MKMNGWVLKLVLVGMIWVHTPTTSRGDSIARDAISARLDEMQNLALTYIETRHYDIDPLVESKSVQYGQPPEDLQRIEGFDCTFAFLQGSAYFERVMNERTLAYWNGKGLPAIATQVETISAQGRVEQLTTQRLKDGDHAVFGGINQLSQFSPDVTIDLAVGLRLLGHPEWLSHEDLDAMKEINQSDPNLVVLGSSDGSGHHHELTFDRRLLYGLVSYCCTGAAGNSVEIRNSDFHRFGNVFLPGRSTRTSNILDPSGRVRHPLIFELVLKTTAVGDAKNAESQFIINWPAHLQLFDSRTNDQIDVGPTTRPLTDDDIRSQLAARRDRHARFKAMAQERMRRLANAPTTRP